MRPVWSIVASSVRTNSPTRNWRFDRSSLPLRLLREADRPGVYIADSSDDVDVDDDGGADRGPMTNEVAIDGTKARTTRDRKEIGARNNIFLFFSE
mmetsp:Transcript_59209/g.120710  ORF Transcript_59209/g.120710 Transcript_59209/m.120710 type:complete len:96 (+) Transcript_59209:936-1223(+)